MDRSEKLKELDRLRREAARIELELVQTSDAAWPPRGYYLSYHIMAGMVLGFVGACSSLLFNIVGSVIVEQDPLQLIRVYLTFPMEETAFEVSSGFVLASGCGLYLCTGALFGVPFHLLLSKFFPKAGIMTRFLAVSIMGLSLWCLNFYVLLSWLQPLWFGGSWIVDSIPWWVAMLTHLVFAWTMLLVDRWGSFVAYDSTQSHAGEVVS